ncbi:MAG: DUF357 domain-containing protein [Methanosarcinales archaeon]|nr:DUF357 domain-containing protein [Methanosarcinales archaeon]
MADKPDVAESLRSETVKWLGKAEERLSRISYSGDREFLENIKAYISDAHYFMEQEDLVRAFEAVIWAWAWMEIGERIGILGEGTGSESGRG